MGCINDKAIFLMMKQNKILLIGPLPPPAGGVAVHLIRLSFLLNNDFQFDFVDESSLIKSEYFNIRSLNLLQYLRRVNNSDLIYIHSGSQIFRILHLITGFLLSKKMILTIHSFPFKKKYLWKYLDKLFFKMAQTIIVVNDSILKNILLSKNECLIKNAFLPPTMELEPPLPIEVSEWINVRKNAGDVLVCANAYELKRHNNLDLYGLDMLIEVAKAMVEKQINVSFIFNVASTKKYLELYKNYQLRINDYKIEQNFLLVNEKLSFVQLIENSDFVVRPTNTDGDALAIRESLYLGKPIIASDVVTRPDGTILFRSRDTADLQRKLEAAILGTMNSGFINDGIDYTHEYKDFYINVIQKTLKNQNLTVDISVPHSSSIKEMGY